LEWVGRTLIQGKILAHGVGNEIKTTKNLDLLDTVVHTYNPAIWEADIGGLWFETRPRRGRIKTLS
jgi:hypothetical protein